MGGYRLSPGFNFRMTELQGAVGIAQLKKINFIISKQRENYFKIKKLILKNLNTKEREIPKQSFISADALCFYLKITVNVNYSEVYY